MTDHGTTSTNVIFGRFGRHRADAPVTAPLSQPAIRLHFFGMLASFQRGRAGYISDCYLAAIDTGASPSAIADLVDAGVWERSDDGYQVRQLEIMRIATELAHHLAQQPLSATPASPRADAGAPRRIGFGEINTGHAACRKGVDLAAVESVGVPRDGDGRPSVGGIAGREPVRTMTVDPSEPPL